MASKFFVEKTKLMVGIRCPFFFLFLVPPKYLPKITCKDKHVLFYSTGTARNA
jgi:hypothetical protein